LALILQEFTELEKLVKSGRRVARRDFIGIPRTGKTDKIRANAGDVRG
jgi:hypothetical protein